MRLLVTVVAVISVMAVMAVMSKRIINLHTTLLIMSLLTLETPLAQAHS
ncbi:MAG: hypothetical protein GX857_13180 [Bacteroidales bacterium]|nr:hypothetical protein [Bacteroidales bacterium]